MFDDKYKIEKYKKESIDNIVNSIKEQDIINVSKFLYLSFLQYSSGRQAVTVVLYINDVISAKRTYNVKILVVLFHAIQTSHSAANLPLSKFFSFHTHSKKYYKKVILLYHRCPEYTIGKFNINKTFAQQLRRGCIQINRKKQAGHKTRLAIV